MNLRNSLFLLAAACSLFASNVSLRAQGTAFTYQGELLSNGNPASGNYDLAFSLFATNSTNSGQIGATITNLDVSVSKGLFMVTLDFGANFFGASRWLAIGVRTNGATAFTALNPLQELQPTPYAIYSGNAGTAASAVLATVASTASSVAASNINGTVSLGSLPSNLALLNSNQTFTGANTFSNAVTFNTGAGTLQVVNDSGVVPGMVASGGLASGHMRFRNGFEVWPSSTPTNGGYLDVRGTNTPNSPTITLTGNTGSIVASNVTASFSGNGGNLTGLNASQLTSGQVPLTQLPPVITNGQSAVTLSNVTLAGVTVVSSNITSSGYPYLYYDGQNNFFAGPFAGNPTTGNGNTAVGYSALYSLGTASSNTALGSAALFSDTTGSNNTATGNGALNANTTGSDNTANGYQALFSNSSGNGNTAAGFHSLLSSTNALDNSAYGVGTLLANLNGNNNTALGYQALRNVPNGSNNIAVGFQAGSAFNAGESGNIDIGNNGVAGDNNSIRIGNSQASTYIAGVINGNGNGLVSLNANNITGAIADANLPSDVALLDANETFTGQQTVIAPFTINAGAATLQVINDNGVVPGMVASGGLASGHMRFRNGLEVWPSSTPTNGGYLDIRGTNNPNVPTIALNGNTGAIAASNITATMFNGDGSGLINLNASQLSGGQIPQTALPPSTVTNGESYVTLKQAVLNGDGSGNFLAGTGTGGSFILSSNTAVGQFALNNGGDYANTAIGFGALSNGEFSELNTAVGALALANNGEGYANTALGYASLASASNGSYNIAIGWNAGSAITTGNDNIDIGHPGEPGDSGVIRIGYNSTTAIYLQGIYGIQSPAGSIDVSVDSNGQLGVSLSSARFKRDIRSMDDASDALLSLRPVTFKYKADIDPKGVPEFGLIAEEVEKVDPDLIVRDKEGNPYTVRYQAVNAMLLNEFQKQHKEIVQQHEEIQALRAKAAKVDALEEQLQKLQAAVQELAQSR